MFFLLQDDIFMKCKKNIEVLNSTMDCFKDTNQFGKECQEIKGKFTLQFTLSMCFVDSSQCEDRL